MGGSYLSVKQGLDREEVTIHQIVNHFGLVIEDPPLPVGLAP